MQLTFYKYHGTGNDFIIIDNRNAGIQLSRSQVAQLCHRRFSIGADGLMLLENAEGYDFRMVYYNADGNESTMCGNGGRCIIAFAHKLGLIHDTATFLAIDGTHTAIINTDNTISLHMQDVSGIERHDNHTILNTGSPHYVTWVNDVQDTDVYTEGRRIRYSEPYMPAGINVNFVQLLDGKLWVRTYERGVEDETLSCGTGVTASAIAATAVATGSFNTLINTPGGQLQVSFTKATPDTAGDVILTGNAVFVYEGKVEL
ncbi:MAG: diaminopimelate epimerase [Taibaiella sp.]|nr:diaminopimelate epimerase [Taibaiella sp.]